MTRERIATALLGLGAFAYAGSAVHRVLAGAPYAVAILPLVLAGTYGALAWGVHRGATWARWLGMGVAFYATLAALGFGAGSCAGGCAMQKWAMVALHAPLPLLLARPDATHPRTSVSLLLAGAALIPTLVLGTQSLVFGFVTWGPAAAAILAAVGVVGVARSRTWGLLVLGGAGLVLLWPSFACGSCGCASATSLGRHAALAAVLLLAAVLPFAGPMTRFLRGRRG